MMEKTTGDQEKPSLVPKTGQVVNFIKVPASNVPAASIAPKPSEPARWKIIGLVWTLLKWILAFGVVAALGWYFGADYVLGPVVKTDVVKQQNVIQTVVASGQILAPFQVNVGSQVAGVVKAIPVAQGQTVKKGDLLIQLDDTDAHQAVLQAQAAVAGAKAKLDQMTNTTLPAAKETLAQAQATVVAAQADYDRADKLVKQGYETVANLDNYRKALDVSKSQVRSAELQTAAAAPNGTDYLAAQAQYDQAIASQRSAEAKLTYYQIYATRDGVLTTRNVEAGNTVQPGAVLMVLAPSGITQVDMQIDEVNLGLLKLGQNASVSADAYPKQKFSGVVSYISPAVDPQSGSVDVKLDVANPPNYLRQTMTVSVEIEVARREAVTVVLAADIHDLSGAKPWVMAVENGRTKRLDISVGTIGDDAVEVLDGTKPGDVILRGQALGVSNGQRVRLPSND